MVRELLELAACLPPSGTNIQPWRVYALSGKDKEALSQAILAKHEKGESDGEQAGLEYYPKEWVEPWLSRRAASAVSACTACSASRRGRGTHGSAQRGRNFIFFDAPVGLIFTFDNRLGKGMLVDYGMFLGNLMTAAHCPRPRHLLPKPISPITIGPSRGAGHSGQRDRPIAAPNGARLRRPGCPENKLITGASRWRVPPTFAGFEELN